MSDQTEIPDVTIERFAVTGWLALDQWACRNHPIWRKTSYLASQSGLDDYERLKLLCFFLLRQNFEIKKTLIKALNENPRRYDISDPRSGDDLPSSSNPT